MFLNRSPRNIHPVAMGVQKNCCPKHLTYNQKSFFLETEIMKSNQKNIAITLCLIIFLTLITPCLADSQKTIDLSSMDLSKMTSGWGKPVANKSIENKPLTLAGKVYDTGVGTHATSIMFIDLKGQYKARDLWRQKDIGIIKDTYTEKIPRHGVILLRLFPK